MLDHLRHGVLSHGTFWSQRRNKAVEQSMSPRLTSAPSLQPLLKALYFILEYSPLTGEGNGTPLQYSCLENPMDGGAWKAAVHGVTEGRTGLSDLIFTFHFHALKEMATHSSGLPRCAHCSLWGTYPGSWRMSPAWKKAWQRCRRGWAPSVDGSHSWVQLGGQQGGTCRGPGRSSHRGRGRAGCPAGPRGPSRASQAPCWAGLPRPHWACGWEGERPLL